MLPGTGFEASQLASGRLPMLPEPSPPGRLASKVPPGRLASMLREGCAAGREAESHLLLATHVVLRRHLLLATHLVLRRHLLIATQLVL